MTLRSNKFTSADICLISVFSALIAVCSWIYIQIGEVPITMQTFAVFLCVSLLGLKRGTISVLIYIFIGALGVPVFSGFKGGLQVITGATGGYIVGFVFTALLTGFLIEKLPDKLYFKLAAMAAGLIVCYAFGTGWFMLIYTRSGSPIGFVSVVSTCVLPFIVPDLIKISAAAALSSALARFIKPVKNH